MRNLSYNVYPRLVNQQDSTKYDNLLVSGCSFTASGFNKVHEFKDNLIENYNRIKDDSWPNINSILEWSELSQDIKDEVKQHYDYTTVGYITWPVYTRDLLGFKNLYDCSCSGAGNKHIHDSIIYEIETNENINPNNTFVVVMWSGFNRDDFIADSDAISEPFDPAHIYEYDENVWLAYTGGEMGVGNTSLSMDNVKKIKSYRSRCIDNFIQMKSLESYLQNNNYQYVFTNFWLDARAQGYDIDEYLGNLTLPEMLEPTIGEYAHIKHLKALHDDFHPTSWLNMKWAEKILLPKIKSIV